MDYVSLINEQMNKTLTSNLGPIKPRDLLSTGSTLLNLALSGIPFGGWGKGRYYNFVGDSGSAKTFMCLTIFAEAVRNKNFAKHRFIYDGVEDGALMDFEHYFGRKLTERLEAPNVEDGEPCSSTYISDFYFNVDSAIQKGEPFIYVLDSMDALDTKQAEEKFMERKKARGKGTKVAGEFGDGKAKDNSNSLRRLITPLKDTGSILLVISQTRDNLGFGAQFNPKLQSGGRALLFYATCQLWSSVAGQIHKTVKGKKRQIGMVSQVRTKKNRQEGKDRSVRVPILHGYGVDDIRANIEYLVEEGRWTESNGKIKAVDFELDKAYSIEKLITYIEDNSLEKQLQLMVAETWDEIEAQCTAKRKKKYDD